MTLVSSYGVTIGSGNVTNENSSNSQLSNALGRAPGCEHFSIRLAWSLIQPVQPSDPTVYNFSEYDFSAPNLSNYWQKVHDFNTAGFDTLTKIMPTLGTFFPAWVVDPTKAGVNVLDTITKLQVTPGGTGATPFLCPYTFSPALRYWGRGLYRAINDYGETTCPGSGGAFHTGTHKIKDHWYSVQANWPMVDNNTEMAEDFENHPKVTWATTKKYYLKTNIPAAYVESPVTGQFATTLAAIGLPAQGQVFSISAPIADLVGQTEQIIDLRLLGSADHEIFYCLDARDDGAGGTEFLVTPPAITGLATGGRGWCGGLDNAVSGGGAYSRPNIAWTAGSQLVQAFSRLNSDKNVYGDPGAANRKPFVFPGGRTEVGMFDVAAVNQNMWARKGQLDPALYVPAVRGVGGAVIRGTAVRPNTLNNRLRIYTRCWMDAAEDTNELITNTATRKIYVWLNLGKVWGVKGAQVAATSDAIPIDPLTYIDPSPDNAARDYFTTGSPHPLAGRLVMGHTNLAYPLVDSNGNPTPGGGEFQREDDYEHCDFHTILNRGGELAIQHESGGAGAESDDCIAALEWAIKHFGSGKGKPGIRWLEFGDDRNSSIIVSRDGVTGKINDPALYGGTGNSDWLIPGFHGTTITPVSRTMNEPMFGYVGSSNFVAAADPAFAGGTYPPSLALNARMKLFGVSGGSKVGTALASLAVSGSAFGLKAVTDQGTVEGGGGTTSDIGAGRVEPVDTSVDMVTWIDAKGVRHPMTEKDGICIGQSLGRFLPPVVFQEQVVPTQSGAILTGVRHGVRELTQPVLFEASDAPTIRQLLRDWCRRFGLLIGDGILEYKTPLGDVRQLICRYSDGMTLDETNGIFGIGVQKALLVFRAVDPYFKDAEDTVISYRTTAPQKFFPIFPLVLAESNVLGVEGLTAPQFNSDIPFNAPISFNSTDQSGGAIIENLGDVEAWPVWTIEGPGDNLTLGNLTTGEIIKVTATLAPTDRLTIDTRPRHKFVTLNGTTNLFPQLLPGSSLWSLAPGDNVLQVELSNTGDETRIDLAYRRQWLSV